MEEILIVGVISIRRAAQPERVEGNRRAFVCRCIALQVAISGQYFDSQVGQKVTLAHWTKTPDCLMWCECMNCMRYLSIESLH